MTYHLNPAELIERTAQIVDVYAFNANEPLSDSIRRRREVARRKAVAILKMLVEAVAAAQDATEIAAAPPARLLDQPSAAATNAARVALSSLYQA